MVSLSPILIGDSREAIYLLRSDIKEKRGTKGKRLAIHVAMHESANGPKLKSHDVRDLVVIAG